MILIRFFNRFIYLCTQISGVSSVLVTHLPHPTAFMLLYYLLALGCVFVWGCTFISSKILLQAGLQPVDILLLRFGMAYLLLLPFYRKHLRLPSWKDEAWMIFLGITGGSLYFLTENTAIKYTLTTNASLIVSLTPLYTMLLMRVVKRKSTRLSSRMLIGSLLAVIGVFSVVMNGHILLELNPLGDFLSLVLLLTCLLLCGSKVVCSAYHAQTLLLGFYNSNSVCLCGEFSFPCQSRLRPACRMGQSAFSGHCGFLALLLRMECGGQPYRCHTRQQSYLLQSARHFTGSALRSG